jgi:hypothetical protein
MKRLVETVDGGFEAMLGEQIQVWCGVYIYAGVVVGVNEDHIELDKALLVYETGELTAKTWKDAQPLGDHWRVMKAAIESWGPGR